MTVVVDLGCYPHQGIDSLTVLADLYEPRLLLGFDPLAPSQVFRYGNTVVITVPLAAWTRVGTVAFREDGIGSTVEDYGQDVGCFDIAELLSAFAGENTIVKMDIEGAEYPVLEHLVETGSDENVGLMLIEWHEQDARREALVATLKCPIEEWTL